MTPVCQSVIGALSSPGLRITAANRRRCLFSFLFGSSNTPALRRPPPSLPVELLNCQEEEKVKASRVYFDEHSSSPPSPQLEPHAERLQREEGRRRDLITRYSGALKVGGIFCKNTNFLSAASTILWEPLLVMLQFEHHHLLDY